MIPDVDRIAAARWAARHLLLPALVDADPAGRREHVEGIHGAIHSLPARRRRGAGRRSLLRHSPSGYTEE